MDTPSVFFSYSLTKSSKRSLIERVIKRLKKKVKEQGWKVEDALTPGIESIREKVEESLWRADAAIVEITTNSPNVMFEVGLARALSYPCIFLVNKGAHDDPSLKKYFEFLKLDARRPLAADLGDIEYLCYPEGQSDATSWKEFEQKTDRVFQVVEKLLASETLLVKRSAKKMLQSCADFVAKHSNTHPLIGFVGGRLSMLEKGFEKLGHNIFQTEAKHYHDSLAAYLMSKPSESWKVLAVADRSSHVETFWENKRDPLKTSVAERLFLVDWRVFYNREDFERLHDLLQAEAAMKYSVRLGIKGKGYSQHVLGKDAIGEDLLLIAPDLVGGYIKDLSEDMLHVQKDEQLYRRGEEHYQSIKNRTLEIRRGMPISALRRAWLELNNIGFWNLEWGEPDTRHNCYFDNYDQHIRCWIPGYENLIRHCAALTEEAIANRMRETNRSLKVLEIGYGTGELSASLLPWMDNLNAPVEALHRPRIISEYLAIDSAARMQDVVKKRFPDRKSYQMFEVCSAPTWSVTVQRYAPYDVICGSLVLHDMVAGNAEEKVEDKMEEVLHKLVPVTSESSLVIFADVFLSDDKKVKRSQLEKWKNYMREIGMSDQAIGNFFEGNPELVDTLTINKIDAVVKDSGFSRVDLAPICGANGGSPLGVLILQKRSGK